MINYTLSEKAANLRLGRYRHYKGSIVIAYGVANHSENLEEMVVYRHEEDKENHFWVRPIEMFIEEINIEGKMIKRFEYIEN
jgi:hypothetical protein